RRAVLFISAHTADDGALGVILNRPLEKKVSEVVSETPLNALEKVPVFFGGPVGRDRLIFASLEWKTGEGLRLNHNVDVEEANEKLGKDPNSVRAFIGYAGWGADFFVQITLRGRSPATRYDREGFSSLDALDIEQLRLTP